jgi:hypothetical protein
MVESLDMNDQDFGCEYVPSSRTSGLLLKAPRNSWDDEEDLC